MIRPPERYRGAWSKNEDKEERDEILQHNRLGGIKSNEHSSKRVQVQQDQPVVIGLVSDGEGEVERDGNIQMYEEVDFNNIITATGNQSGDSL